jgi:hypothetical protein
VESAGCCKEPSKKDRHCERCGISLCKWPASVYIVTKTDLNISVLIRVVIRSWNFNCVWSVEGTQFSFAWFLILNICTFFMQRYFYEKQNIITDPRLKLFDCCNVATSKTTPTIAMTSRLVLWGHPDIKWQVTLRSVDNLGVWVTSCLINFKVYVLYVGPVWTV